MIQASSRNGFIMAYVASTILAFDGLKFLFKTMINLHYFYNLWKIKQQKKIASLKDSSVIIE